MSADSLQPSFVPVLARFLEARRRESPPDSYSVTVMSDPVLAQRKIMEEAFEVCLELGAPTVDAERLAEESADLAFHLLCGLVGAGVSWDRVEDALRARHPNGTQG